MNMKTVMSEDERDMEQLKQLVQEVRVGAESVARASQSLRDVAEILSAYIENGPGVNPGPVEHKSK